VQTFEPHLQIHFLEVDGATNDLICGGVENNVFFNSSLICVFQSSMPSQTEVVWLFFLPLIRQEEWTAKYCAVMQIISIHRYIFWMLLILIRF
jgi:hypothetical protein